MTDNPLLPAIGDSVDALAPELVALRRDLHAHPELARERDAHQPWSSAERLAAAGIGVRPLPGTGLVADLGAEQPAYRVALRADLDALPVRERTGLAWASTTDGVCHACGHDVHVAAVLGAGLALKEHEEALRERGIGVRLFFQPAEEVIPGGAIDVSTQGGLDGVDAVFAVHCDPSLRRRPGGPARRADHRGRRPRRGHLSGRGGHTSRPAPDPGPHLRARQGRHRGAGRARRAASTRAPALALVWGEVHAGSASNVIPSVGHGRAAPCACSTPTPGQNVGPPARERRRATSSRRMP